MSLSSKKIGSLAEAESFMLGVQKLLTEYNLELSMLEGITEKSNITEEKIEYKGLVSYGDWEVDLMYIICQYNWCTCFYNDVQKTITIIGRGDNLDIVKYLYNFITINLSSLSKVSYYGKLEECNVKLTAHYGYDVKAKYGKKFEEIIHKNKFMPYRRYYIRDYLAGAVIGINNKMAFAQSEQSKNTNINSVILFNKDKIDNYLVKYYPNLTKIKDKSIKRGQGYDEGYNDGYNLHIGDALGGVKDKVVLH
jgi:hypothetical protein